ncbi:unnamed protein product [Sympodiomycopsis kandeliae]
MALEQLLTQEEVSDNHDVKEGDQDKDVDAVVALKDKVKARLEFQQKIALAAKNAKLIAAGGTVPTATTTAATTIKTQSTPKAGSTPSALVKVGAYTHPSPLATTTETSSDTTSPNKSKASTEDKTSLKPIIKSSSSPSSLGVRKRISADKIKEVDWVADKIKAVDFADLKSNNAHGATSSKSDKQLEKHTSSNSVAPASKDFTPGRIHYPTSSSPCDDTTLAAPLVNLNINAHIPWICIPNTYYLKYETSLPDARDPGFNDLMAERIDTLERMLEKQEACMRDTRAYLKFVRGVARLHQEFNSFAVGPQFE